MLFWIFGLTLFTGFYLHKLYKQYANRGGVFENKIYLTFMHYVNTIHNYLYPTRLDWRNKQSIKEIKKSLKSLSSRVKEIWLPFNLSRQKFLDLLIEANQMDQNLSFIVNKDLIDADVGYEILNNTWIIVKCKNEFNKRNKLFI